MHRTVWVVFVGLAVGCFRSDPPPVSEPPAQEPDETLVVYSLEPMGPLGEKQEPGPGEVLFRRYIVIGSTPVTDPKLRQQIVESVQSGVDESLQEDRQPFCFKPRHGLRHVAKDGAVWEWLICFECGMVSITHDGIDLVWDRPGSGEGVSTPYHNITRGPQKLLNDTLGNAGVKLAAGAENGE